MSWAGAPPDLGSTYAHLFMASEDGRPRLVEEKLFQGHPLDIKAHMSYDRLYEGEYLASLEITFRRFHRMDSPFQAYSDVSFYICTDELPEGAYYPDYDDHQKLGTPYV